MSARYGPSVATAVASMAHRDAGGTGDLPGISALAVRQLVEGHPDRYLLAPRAPAHVAQAVVDRYRPRLQDLVQGGDTQGHQLDEVLELVGVEQLVRVVTHRHDPRERRLEVVLHPGDAEVGHMWVGIDVQPTRLVDGGPQLVVESLHLVALRGREPVVTGDQPGAGRAVEVF